MHTLSFRYKVKRMGPTAGFDMRWAGVFACWALGVLPINRTLTFKDGEYNYAMAA